MDVFDLQEHFSIHTRLGYGSRYDEDELELDLCCECMDKLIDECVIPPIIENEGRDEYSAYEEELEYE